MLNYWFSSDKKTYVAEENNEILGTFYLKENQMDLALTWLMRVTWFLKMPEEKGLEKQWRRFH